MNITHDNERKVIDTIVETDHLVLEGQAEFLSDRIYLHGRILDKENKYVGQYSNTIVRILDASTIYYTTEASEAIDELAKYVSQLIESK